MVRVSLTRDDPLRFGDAGRLAVDGGRDDDRGEGVAEEAKPVDVGEFA